MVENAINKDSLLIMKKDDFEKLKQVLDIIKKNVFDYITIKNDNLKEGLITFKIEKKSIIEILKINEITFGYLLINGDIVKYEGLHNNKLVTKMFSLTELKNDVKKIIDTLTKGLGLVEVNENQIFNEIQKEDFINSVKGHKILMSFQSEEDFILMLNHYKDNFSKYKNIREFIEEFSEIMDEKSKKGEL